jgi:CxxC-x17-CxxC domain-containing protein
VTTQVPFRPTPGKPVYCRDCFQSVRSPKGVGT